MFDLEDSLRSAWILLARCCFCSFAAAFVRFREAAQFLRCLLPFCFLFWSSVGFGVLLAVALLLELLGTSLAT